MTVIDGLPDALFVTDRTPVDVGFVILGLPDAVSPPALVTVTRGVMELVMPGLPPFNAKRNSKKSAFAKSAEISFRPKTCSVKLSAVSW